MRNKRNTFRLIVMMTMALVLAAGSAVTSSAASFSDVPDNAWYKADLDEMVQTGLVRGYSDCIRCRDGLLFLSYDRELKSFMVNNIVELSSYAIPPSTQEVRL